MVVAGVVVVFEREGSALFVVVPVILV